MPGNINVCIADYYCKKIEATEKGDCNAQELLYQAKNVDQFVKALGEGVDFEEFEKADRKTAQLVEVFNKNAKSLGLPKIKNTTFELRKDLVDTVCLEYKKTDGSLIKQVLHEKVGDISEDINNPVFTGNSSSIEYLDWQDSSVGIRVCFTGMRD